MMHFVAAEGFDDIYRPEDLALMATVRVDYLAFSYYASRTLNSDAIRRERRSTTICCLATVITRS